MTTTFTRPSILSALLTLTVAAAASAAHPQGTLVHPGHGSLPRFGFDSYNVSGYGEMVTRVHFGSLASQLGLEQGDAILSLNGFRLTYHGAWRNALSQAVSNGGFVRLAIRDVHTGQIVYRQTQLPGCGIGPITPKVHVAGYGNHYGNHYNDHCHTNPGYPGPIVGPITPKSKQYTGNQKFNNNFNNVKNLIEKFKKD